MNSTTGDFTEIRKSIPDEIYNRGAHTAVKRKPRKWILRPLNIDGIKRDIEEAAEEDEKVTIPMKSDGEANVDKEEAVTDTELPRTDINEGVGGIERNHIGQKLLLDGRHLTDVTNFESVRTTRTSESKDAICHNSDKCSVPEVNENRLILFQEHKNDSFDLDFSALPLSTPVKLSKDSNKNSTLNSMKLEPGKPQQFITPKVNNTLLKSQHSLSKKPFLKTPLSSYIVPSKNNHTPYQSTLSRRISPTIIENEGTAYNERNTLSNYLGDKEVTPAYNVPMRNGAYKNGEVRNSIPSSLKDDTFKKIKVNGIEYIMFGLVGKGGSSEVYECYNLESKVHVAIKCVSLDNCASANSYINEVKLLQQLQNCSKIIKMYDYQIVESHKKLLVVLERGGKDLSAILKQLAGQKSHIPRYMLFFYWMEILYAVQQIHMHGIIHSDLKPANFLKVDEGLKLIDFGIASSVQTDMTSVIKTKQEGSCNYISPEALNSDSTTNFGKSNSENYKIHYKSDVWSLGCILYQFVYKRTPFQHITQLWPKLAAIMNPEHKIDYADVEWVSPKMISIMKKCLQYNVKLRPSVDELIAECDTFLQNI